MERFKVTLSDDTNLKKQYGSTTGAAPQVETSIARGNLEIDFSDSLGRMFQVAYV